MLNQPVIVFDVNETPMNLDTAPPDL